jgi:lipopolysaccharide assembly protein A
MRIIIGALWLVLFLVLFAFAVNNTAMTELNFFAGMSMKAPLIALLLAFFIGGFAFGLIALLPAWVRQRVEIRRLRRVATRPVDKAPVSAARPMSAETESFVSTDVIQTVARGARTTN